MANRWMSNVPATVPVPSASVPATGAAVGSCAGRGFAVAVPAVATPAKARAARVSPMAIPRVNRPDMSTPTLVDKGWLVRAVAGADGVQSAERKTRRLRPRYAAHVAGWGLQAPE